MGKSKDPILKIKTQDFKKLSQQFEIEAQRLAEKKRNHGKKAHQESLDKNNLDGLIRNRNRSSDNERSFELNEVEKHGIDRWKEMENKINTESSLVGKEGRIRNMMEIGKERRRRNRQASIDEKDRGRAENRTRDEKENLQVEKILKSYLNYTYRDYHYFYETPYAKPKLIVSCFKEEANKEATELLEEDYKKSYDKPLLSYKNLARYDCWPDKSPEEWIKICQENTNEFDGNSRIFEDNEYLFKRVKVLDYDPTQLKYKIIFLHSDQIKHVFRLSLTFFCEDRKEFQYRKYICEEKRERVDVFLKFTRYVDAVPDYLISRFNPKNEKKIIHYLKYSTKRLAAKHNHLFNKTRPQFEKEMAVVKQDYTRQMKKCRILMEMEEPDNEEIFVLKDVSLRKFYQKIPTPTECINLPYSKETTSLNYRRFRSKIEELNKKSFFEDKDLAKVIVSFLKKTEEMKKMGLLIESLEESRLPLELKDFVTIRDEFEKKSSFKLGKFAFDLNNLIMESLQEIQIESNKDLKKYDFYMMEDSSYPSSRIKKVLQYFNIIFHNKIKELINKSILNFVKYFQRFEVCNLSSAIFEESKLPLFLTKLKLEEVVEKDPAKGGKIVKKHIVFEPKLDEFSHHLTKSMSHMKTSINNLNDIMSQSMKCIELEKKKLFDLGADYPVYANSKAEIERIFKQAKTEANERKEEFKKYEKLLTFSAEAYIDIKLGDKAETNKNLKIDLCEQLLKEYSDKNIDVDYLETEINLKIFRIQAGELKSLIKERIEQTKLVIIDRMKGYSNARMLDLHTEYETKMNVLKENPKNINEYKNLYDILQGTPQYVQQKEEELKNIGGIVEIMEKQSCEVNKVFYDLINHWKIPQFIKENYQDRKDGIETKKKEFAEILNDQIKVFEQDLSKHLLEFDIIRSVDSLDAQDDKGRPYCIHINDFSSSLKKVLDTKDDIKKNTKILFPEKNIEEGEDEYVKFAELDELKESFQYYKIIWSENKDIDDVYINLTGVQPLSDIKPNVTNTPTGVKESFQYVKSLEESRLRVEDVLKRTKESTLMKLSMTLKEKIKEYESYNWIVSSLKSHFFEQADWNDVKEFLKIDDSIPLVKLREDYKIDDYREKIEFLKTKAVRRHNFLIELRDIGSIYSSIKFSEPKDKPALKDIDKIQEELDELSNRLNNIISNQVTQSNKMLRENSRGHNEKIKNVQNILEQIIKFQSYYLYLEPIFTTAGIEKELPDLKEDFRKVNDFWKLVLDNMYITAWTLEAYFEKENLTRLLSDFENYNVLLNKIIIKLNIYLNIKRTEFPRFYFLSDEDLMKILAQRSDPLLIQPHIGKCFEGMSRVKFSEDISTIVAMESSGESVELQRKVKINDEICRGNVEVWLGQLEDSMRKTMQSIIKSSLEDFHQNDKRIEWIKSGWPGQVVQVVDSIAWTSRVDKAIEEYENLGLEQYLRLLNEDLQDVVALVRTDISKTLSTTLSGLIVVSVHNRDIVETLKEKDIRSRFDFDWISQMRYIWNEAQGNKSEEPPCPLKVLMVTSELNYGFEYLGNITRLVITPLTDRCFRTLFGAYQVKFGGAPEGPAGTGKTESVKDLGKAVGVMCNVFNCTEGIKIQGMSKFFKGLASSGCWCCFDEFNRIDTEVLSVIAQQILTIQNALKAELKTFFFEEGEKIVLKDTCAINITMNPSYSGRNELPDNLKALFRPCAMMVADYNLIAQIKLYSFGFDSAKSLSNKIVSSLKLSSEQLSTQSHYDFGMRSLNAILVAAGKIKKKNPNIDESRIALRALVDVNLPKFTTNDTPLFKGIVGDLFPDVSILESDLSVLEDGLKEACLKTNLQPTMNFLKKCVQLYETLNVRHALMIVGRPGMCKSRVHNTLRIAMESLKGKSPSFNTVEINCLNPKSILQKQLYGYFEMNQEWKKGLLQVKMSELIEKEKSIIKWLIFDGPVDTLWIENMNSLLDDNKKLCLEDSSSIMLGENMNIIFEVDDLKEASPATVSRNGMVLCETDTIDTKDLIESYASTLPLHVFDSKAILVFKEVSHFLTRNILSYIFKYGQLGLPTDKFHLVKSYLDIFECFMKEYRSEEISLNKDKEIINDKLENLMIFSCIIGILGPVKRPPKFQEFLYDMITETDINQKYHLGMNDFSPRIVNAKLNDIEDIFDMVYNPETNKWIKWTDIQQKKEFKVTEDLKFNDLVIPTADTIKMAWLVNMVVPAKKHLLITGNTGTGKTLTVINTLNNYYDNDHYTFVKMSMTAQTSANFTQSVIEGKLQKSYRKFSPHQSKKAVIFIDDLNMPQKEKFGAQPPIELLRQWMDYGGWYDLNSDTKDFIHVVDVSFVTAMGSVSSGRTVSHRYLRHFLVHYAETYSKNTMSRIFSFVMDWFFMKNKNPRFTEKILNMKDSIISGTIGVYLAASSQFKATPMKTHYTFNLRDVSRVFQGISRASGYTLKNESDMLKIWIHECERVFKDRLVSHQDRNEYDLLIANQMKVSMNRSDFPSLVKDGPILFGDFVGMIHIDGDEKKPCLPSQYCELYDYKKLKSTVQNCLTQYNEEVGRGDASSSLSLVLFNYAIEHVVRISRIISTPNGNALLVGVGGSGRKSLTMLATYIYYPMTLYQIENTSNLDKNTWRDSLKALIQEYALSGKETVFFLSDTQISQVSFLEDINNMLNTGEVPNLFESSEIQNNKENIPNEFIQTKKMTTDGDILSAIVECCKAKIHLVLSMSPIGEEFRKRIMMFPSLVNCTTIDWFLEWPEEALLAVANFYLAGNIEEKYLKDICQVCVDMQSRVLEYSERFKVELRRYYYVTPMSYIELLNIFKKLLSSRTEEINNEIMKYSNGLEIIKDSEKTAREMDEYIITVLAPQLEEQQKACSELILQLQEMSIDLKRQAADAEVTRAEAEKIEVESKLINETATTKLKEIEKIKADLKLRMKGLKQDDVSLLKKSRGDSAVIELSRLLCLLILKNPHPKPTLPGASPKDPLKPDYHKYAIENLFDSSLFKKLSMHEEKVSEMDYAQMVYLRSECEKCEIDWMKKSIQFDALFNIVRLLNEVYFINLEYLPAKQKADDSARQYKESQEKLREITEKVEAICKLQKSKEEERDNTKKKVEELQRKNELCRERSANAKVLKSSLENEKTNWEIKKLDFQASASNIIGDILISSGIIAYLGAFTKSYREEIIESWANKISNGNIPLSLKKQKTLIMRGIVSDEFEIETWKAQKLPFDDVSIDNAIIIKQSRRCCLLIDPQNQAFEWIQEKIRVETEQRKEKEKNNNYKKKEDQLLLTKTFQEIKPTMDRNSQLKIATECVKNGYTLIYSNAGEVLSPYLAPLYKKEYFSEGNNVFSVNLDGKSSGNKIEIDQNFKFFITTKLPKPHYLPEICVAMTIVNFTVTEAGLEDQMLNYLIEKEDPATDQQRKSLIEKKNQFNQSKRDIEKDILEELAKSKQQTSEDSSILDNKLLIQKLYQSKQNSQQIEESLASQKEIENSIENKRKLNQPTALHVAELFFTVSDLSNIEPVYQYSLKSYKDIFGFAINETQQTVTDKSKKLEALKENFTAKLYDKVCMSLFEKDKIVFSFLLAVKSTMIHMSPEVQVHFRKECRHLVTGGSGKKSDIPNPKLSQNVWNSLCELASISPNFEKVPTSFSEKIEEWAKVMSSSSPAEETFPSPYESMELFHKLLLVRIIRPEKTVPALKLFISKILGPRYTSAPQPNLLNAYNESRNDTPIFFILSPGSDPLILIESLCKKLDENFLDLVKNISLGQGQEKVATSSIEAGQKEGKWIVLQNCHLAKSFMDDLEKLIDNIQYNDTSKFRVFLTALPSKVIPISVIQNSIKLTNEPPRGLKKSIERSYGTFEEKEYESCAKSPYVYKRFVYSFCFFHAMILERRKYGPLGWNIPYEFSNSDLSISLKQLRVFLEKYNDIQWEALNYMIAEANYGGRVTDPADRRLISIIFRDFCNKEMLTSSFRFSGMNDYSIPLDGKYEDHLKFIQSLPDNDLPAIFGLHANADITCAINETNNIFNAALLTLPRVGGGSSGSSVEDEVKLKAEEVLSRLPKCFNIDEVMVKHPIKHLESLNSVLHQELMRYNNLIKVILNSMTNLIDAVNGDAVMTSDLEDILTRVYDNRVPANIEKISYPSLKPFASWFNDLLEKLKFMQKWIDSGIPTTFWISGFFFTQSFLTGILQNYARTHNIAIDRIKFDFTIMTDLSEYNLKVKPEDGAYIHGFYLEGARWDTEKRLLDDPQPKILFPEMPMVWFKPVVKEETNENRYICPVYRTSKRAGELSTTGQSTNFLLHMYLPYNDDIFTDEHWVKRGTAILCSLND